MNYDEIIKLKINDTIIKNPRNYFTFQNPGEHKVYIKLKAIDVFSHLFNDIKYLIYIEFSDNGLFKFNKFWDLFSPHLFIL